MPSISNPAPSQTIDLDLLRQASDPGFPKLFEKLKEAQSANRAERRDLIAMQKRENLRQKRLEEFEAAVYAREEALTKAEKTLTDRSNKVHAEEERIRAEKAKLEELRAAMDMAFDDRNAAVQAREVAVTKRETALTPLEKKAFVST